MHKFEDTFLFDSTILNVNRPKQGGYFFALKLHESCTKISLWQKQKSDRIYTTDNKEGKRMIYNQPNAYGQYPQNGMNYNNGYSMQSSQMPQDQPRNSAELICISSIQQAREFVVPPNTIKYFLNTVDYELYAKAADSFGITSFKASKLNDFDPNMPQQAQMNNIDYSGVINMLAERVSALENEIMKNNQTTPDYLDNGGNKNESNAVHGKK